MVILICQFGNETNTFAPGYTGLAQLSPGGWIPGQQVESRFGSTRSFLGGAISAIRQAGHTPLCIDLLTNNGNFGAGPIMTGQCARDAMDHICREVECRKGQFDGIYFALHGAGVCEFDQDLEGYTLERLRQVVGNDMPIFCTLDLHANLTARMVRLADGLFCIKENPHNDCCETAALAVTHLMATIQQKESPKVGFRSVPMLVSPVNGSTLSGPGKQVKDFFERYRQEHGLIDCAFVHGFSAADVACSRASVLVVADGEDPAPHAEVLAGYVWSLREAFTKVEIPDAAVAVEQARLAVKDGYVVINEGSDNPGSGGPGDATHLLRELLRRDLPGTIMGPLFDPETAGWLHTHKPGDRVNIILGGKTMAISGPPLEIRDAEILTLSDGKFISAAPINKGVPMDFGPTARLRKGNVEFIVVSVRYQTLDDCSFRMAGAELANYKIVGLKSMNHFRGFFTSIADAIITADTPGARPANLLLYPYQNIQRPVHPLDDVTDLLSTGDA